MANPARDPIIEEALRRERDLHLQALKGQGAGDLPAAVAATDEALSVLRGRLEEAESKKATVERVKVYELSPEVAEMQRIWEARTDAEHNRVHELEDVIAELRASLVTLTDALRAFFAEYDGDHGQYAPSDATEALMRAALLSSGVDGK
jgi:hypothetical protein